MPPRNATKKRVLARGVHQVRGVARSIAARRYNAAGPRVPPSVRGARGQSKFGARAAGNRRRRMASRTLSTAWPTRGIRWRRARETAARAWRARSRRSDDRTRTDSRSARGCERARPRTSSPRSTRICASGRSARMVRPHPVSSMSYVATDPSPCAVMPAAASSVDGPPKISRHRLWPMIAGEQLRVGRPIRTQGATRDRTPTARPDRPRRRPERIDAGARVEDLGDMSALREDGNAQVVSRDRRGASSSVRPARAASRARIMITAR